MKRAGKNWSEKRHGMQATPALSFASCQLLEGAGHIISLYCQSFLICKINSIVTLILTKPLFKHLDNAPRHMMGLLVCPVQGRNWIRDPCGSLPAQDMLRFDEQYVSRPSSTGQCGWCSVVLSKSSFAGSDSNGKGTAGVCLGSAFPHGLVSCCSCILSFLKISCEPASSHGFPLSKTSTWLRVSVT